jgi:hypothetical protein
VPGGGEHRPRVAARARHRLRGAEGVRRVAAGAPRVAAEQDLGPGARRTARARVARHAARVGDVLGLVHGVAVEAAAHAAVLRARRGVAPLARGRIERGRAVRAVAVAAGLAAVRAHRGGAQPLGAVVAAHARARSRSEVGPEAVAILAARRVRDPERVRGMERRRHGPVAALAQPRGWGLPHLVGVALRARDPRLVDVHAVPRAVARG